jgi:multidrug efflux system outer membrane protein
MADWTKGIHVVRSSIAASVLAILAACAVGPEYRQPELELPSGYVSDAARIARGAAGAVPTASRTEVAAPLPNIDAPFWQRFEDPLLDELVATALRENHDLKQALARFDEANALLREAKFDFLPTVTAGAGVSNSRSSADQLPGSRADRDTNRYSAQVDIAWELDVFGRVRRNVETQRADAAASAADLAAVQVAIVGEVARSYLELRGVQERLDVARENAENQRETLRIVEARLDAGRGTEFDTSRARSQLETTLSRIPAFASAVDVTMHRLAVLTGQPPGALVSRLDAAARRLPELPGTVDAGAPGELLRRRPDVIAAEQRLQAATARIGVATADLFPRFTLGGLVGTQALESSALFGRDSESRFVALGVDWSFLDVGRVRARIAATDAAASGALAQYEQTVLRALEETENALVRYGHARLEDAHLERSAFESARAAELAHIRFDAGAADLLDVLDAERSQLQAQDAFADGRTRSATALVDLYRSLAGGWPKQPPERERVSAR